MFARNTLISNKCVFLYNCHSNSLKMEISLISGRLAWHYLQGDKGTSIFLIFNFEIIIYS